MQVNKGMTTILLSQELQALAQRRYIPAVLADVVEVSQLAVSHLPGVVLEQRHAPHSVTRHNTSLQHTQTSFVNTGADALRCCVYIYCAHVVPSAAAPRASQSL